MNEQTELERIVKLVEDLIYYRGELEIGTPEEETPIPEVYLKAFGEDSGGSKEVRN